VLRRPRRAGETNPTWLERIASRPEWKAAPRATVVSESPYQDSSTTVPSTPSRSSEVGRPAEVAHDAERAVGEGASRYAGVLGLPHDDELLYPPALDLAELAAQRIRDKAPAEPLTPLYLRRPDAVEPGARKPALR